MAGLVKRGLEEEGIAVDVAGRGEDAVWMAGSTEYDAVVLDVMLPGLDGFEVCRRLRADEVWTPVLMLTARDAVEDRVAGLDGGADDYLVKPFAFEELLAGIGALLRRARPAADEPDRLSFADLELDRRTREVWRGGEPVELTARGFDLLEYFLRHPRQVLTREQIFRAVWESDFMGASNVIDVNISYLRDRLEEGGHSRLIQTVRGVGYALRES